MTHGRTRARVGPRMVTLVVAVCLALLGQATWPSAQAEGTAGTAGGGPDTTQAQVLTWTADNDIDSYASAPSTAVAGEATIVFENSVATGNTTGMPHTLTFTTTNPDYNNDVGVNILANPSDVNGGRHEVTVTLTPGVYHYHCTIPGHGAMQGELVVTEGGGGEDTTPPEVTATVAGEQNGEGAYVGSATVSLAATDDNSGVNDIEYAVDGDSFLHYEAPIVLNTVGTHTVTYRATDRAGNASAEQTVTVEVAEPPDGEDTTPPRVTASVDGERNADGDYVAMATLTLTATDSGGSGVDRVEYAVNGGAFTTYTQPVMLHSFGDYSITYRATDRAGNSSAPGTTGFSIVAPEEEPGEPPADCPESDDRPLIMVGDEHTGVPNRVGLDNCTANEHIQDERAWSSHGSFLTHVREVTDDLIAGGVVDVLYRADILAAAERSGIGEPGNRHGYERIFDGTARSLDRWTQVGGGEFELNDDGSITSSDTVGGLGMLWFPEVQYADFSLRMKVRDDAPGSHAANSGVLVRFPRVYGHPEESRPEWVAIEYGHEIQFHDGALGDQYKTGSVYGFDLVTRAEAMPVPGGVWSDLEIRVIDQHYSVYRNGVLINEFENAPGQLFSPPRSDDPGTDGRQHASGYLGLQTHGTADVVSYRDIRVKTL